MLTSYQYYIKLISSIACPVVLLWVGGASKNFMMKYIFLLSLLLTCVYAPVCAQNVIPMKNEPAQLAVTYRMSFPDKGKKPGPPDSEAFLQKMDQLLADLTFTLHVGRTQSAFFSAYVFDETDPIEQVAKKISQAGNSYYFDAVQQALLMQVSTLGTEEFLQDDTELTWEVHPGKEKEINGLTCYYATGERKSSGWEPTQIDAWFTKDYPVPFGPADFHGLPGLIVQVQGGGAMYKATQIKQLAGDQVTIDMPEVKAKDLMLRSEFLGKMQQVVPAPPKSKGKQ